jgi:hypothetical protein
MNSDLLIISTYPRSGANFLLSNFKKIGIECSIDHDLVNGIFISRNPIDSISSRAAMETNLKIYHKEISNEYYTEIIKNYENKYIHAIENNIIFKFEDVINKVDIVVDFIIKKYNLKPQNKNIEYEIENKFNKNTFVKTSKNFDTYKNIKEELKNFDMSKCLQLYQESYSLSINL